VGTPQYMAPELLRGLAASPQSDLYAAALTIYEMIAGSPPFVGSDTTQVAALHLATAPKPLDEVSDGVPVGVVRAIDRALDKSPGMRFSSALAMADALSGDGHERAAVTVQSRPRNAVREAPAQPALESQPPTKADLPSALAPQRRSHAVLYALAALIVIAGPVGVFIAMRGDSSSTAAPPPPPPTPMAVAADAAVRNTKAEQYLETARTAEASGQRALAVASYRAYLDLEPRAPDADAILAKIVELSPPPSRSAAPDAGVVAPRPRRPAAKKQCACVADREALCVEPQRVMCQCRVGSTPLCAIEPSLGTQCEAPFESEAVGGKGCQGYVHYRGAIMRGAYWCSRCTRPDVYRGHEGEPCAGHDAAGAPYKGKLQRCL